MRRYKLVQPPAGWPKDLPFKLHFPDGDVEVGEEFGVEFSQEEEEANLASGLLEIVPQRYKVVGDAVVHDAQPGEEFAAALSMFEEWHLLVSGNVERVEKPAPPKPKPKADKAKE